MTVPAVLLPVFVQVGLTFFLLFWMGAVRLRALKGREVRLGDIALRQPAWPERPTQISNAYDSQFQLPVLFYALVPLALITRKADLLFVVLSWIFVATRLAHAAIHTTSNNVQQRFMAFLAGAVVLLIMWIVFAAHILLGI
ncbi:MAG TPA: MAPEG family protein [Beijerinckiaceae bacterium]|nr:MAPEG family protein [Beijerinckiaceae bacterium]